MIFNPYWWFFHGFGYSMQKYEQFCDMCADVGSFAVDELDDFLKG